MDWMIRNMPLTLAQSIYRIFPSGASNFNCRHFVDSSIPPNHLVLILSFVFQIINVIYEIFFIF